MAHHIPAILRNRPEMERGEEGVSGVSGMSDIVSGCVCVCEREGERERDCHALLTTDGLTAKRGSVCVCVCAWRYDRNVD